MCESESKVAQSCPTLCDPHGHQAPPSMGFSRQEYWSGFPFPFPQDLPDPGIEPASPVSPTLTGRFFTTVGTCICILWEDTYMLPLTEELSSYFMLNQQPLVAIDLVLGSSQRNISKQLITNSVTPFFLPLERVISKQISPWMVNVLQMEDISNQ